MAKNFFFPSTYGGGGGSEDKMSGKMTLKINRHNEKLMKKKNIFNVRGVTFVFSKFKILKLFYKQHIH